MLKQFHKIFKKLVIFALFFRMWRFHVTFDFHFPAIYKLRNRILFKQIKKSVPDFHSFYGIEFFINQRYYFGQKPLIFENKILTLAKSRGPWY